MNYKTKEILWMVYWSSAIWLPILSLIFNFPNFEEHKYFWLIWGLSFPVLFAYGIGKSNKD